MVASFIVAACIGAMAGFMPDRHMPDGHMPGACYYYFVCRVAAVVFLDKGAAGK
jgi:hypothetical protein